jgi:hypothetical protein
MAVAMQKCRGYENDYCKRDQMLVLVCLASPAQSSLLLNI